MPFKSEKQRKWMWANDPEMAKKWEKEEKMKKETKVRQLIKKMVREVMAEDFGGAFPKGKRDSFNKMREKQSEVLGYKLMGTPDVKTEIDDATIKESFQKRHFLNLIKQEINSLKGQIAYAKDKVRYKGTPDWEKKEFAAILKDKIKDLKDTEKHYKRVEKLKEGKLKEKLSLGGAYEKMIQDTYDGAAQRALTMVRNKVMSKYKVGKKSPVSSEKVTRKLVATHINNGMKELRNKAKSPGLKKAFQKIIDIREKQLKKMKEGKTLWELTEEYVNEGKWSIKGKYLNMPTGEESSIPGPYDNDALKVRVGRESFNIYKGRKGIIAIGDKYSKEFRNARDLIKWLNKSRAKYVGIDRR